MIGFQCKRNNGSAHDVKKEFVYAQVEARPKTALVIALEANQPYKAVIRYLELLRDENRVVTTATTVKDNQRRRRTILKYQLPPASLDSKEILRGIYGR